MFFQDRKIKYSIRKLKVATVSLAIGFLFAPAVMGAAQVAQADELTTTEQVENKAESQVSGGLFCDRASRASERKPSFFELFGIYRSRDK